LSLYYKAIRTKGQPLFNQNRQKIERGEKRHDHHKTDLNIKTNQIFLNDFKDLGENPMISIG